ASVLRRPTRYADRADMSMRLVGAGAIVISRARKYLRAAVRLKHLRSVRAHWRAVAAGGGCCLLCCSAYCLPASAAKARAVKQAATSAHSAAVSLKGCECVCPLPKKALTMLSMSLASQQSKTKPR